MALVSSREFNDHVCDGTPYGDLILDSQNRDDLHRPRDWVQGSPEADVFLGGDGTDFVKAGGGNDFVRGGDGRDILFGEEGNDSVHGDGGDDQLYGGFNNDYLYGDGGNDLLDGGRGDDHLLGGGGSDKFVFEAQSGNDIVWDFEAGHDMLRINGAMTNGTYPTVEELAGRAHQVGQDTVVELEAGNTITLSNVSADDVHAHANLYFFV
ncbi:hypothetical protein BAE42_30915 [Mesorhizobium loti]|uniref:Calcium-binding protein n=1 Tax=Mesorhizobium erdmanii TaxID=1777866 RepID=A0A6M7UQ81_9HYPH|nr:MULTISPECIES: calcium-binding protein [Mesorhizobium]OBP75063.1 hypothetical protein BAE42_30915 [Mesorhizobium loti]OBQ68007.1 hypothetical protein A8146_11405 [Mesorhizobium loti]QKC79381.1 calcium-binding protein [Mesorhizobium erdmanii]